METDLQGGGGWMDRVTLYREQMTGVCRCRSEIGMGMMDVQGATPYRCQE